MSYKDKSKKRAAQRRYRNLHKEEIKLSSKIYREQNREKERLRHKTYIENNKEKCLKANRLRDSKRRKNDLQYRLKRILRSRLKHALNGQSKKQSTLSLLGCDITTFIHHIENQFKPNMSWDNYGFYGWHIDHIKPCESFDLTKIEEQKVCFHYTNLQPLWAEDNLRKGSKTA